MSLQLQGTASTGSLTYNASGLPAGLSLNATTGLISGTLAAGDAANGPYTVDVSASNGTVSASQSFNWIVNPVVNVTVPADQSNKVGDSVSLQISATDSLNKTLSYSASGLPSGLSINSSSGLISGKITGGDPSGGPFVVTVTAADGTYSSSASFNWNVNDTAALTLTVPGTQDNVASDSVVNLQAKASDPDGDALTYSATNLPHGLSIDPSTGLISGIIADDAADPAPYQTTVTASDGNGQSVSQTFTWIVNAPPIIAQAMPLNFTEGVDPGSFTIATFTTPDMNAYLEDFGALIDFGDGTTDSGIISGGNGSFTVTTDHLYAEPGSYPVSILIFNGLTGASTTTSTTATVADGSLTLTGFQLGNPFSDAQGSFILASFIDQNPEATAADYTVTINWGDGSPISQGDYALGQGDGRFLIEANHDYLFPSAAAGPWIYNVSITVQDVDGASASTSSTIVGGRIEPNAPATMGTWVFTDANENATASNFSITINWGDGTSDAGTAVFIGGGDTPSGGDNDGDGSDDTDGDPLIFQINTPAHVYTQDSYDQPNGQYQLTMTVTSPDGNLQGIQYVSVVRPPLNQYTGNVIIPTNLTVSNTPVAVFTVADPGDSTSEFTAQIDWGDGTTGSSTIQELAPGLYQVVGSHTYAVYDWYYISVTISQGWGGTAAVEDGDGLAGRVPLVQIRRLRTGGITTLKVAKWETAFQRLNPGLRPPNIGLRPNFVDFDADRFFVWVKDPVANKDANANDTIDVKVSTSSDAGSTIKLEETGNNTGMFWSDWLLLASVDVDKRRSPNQIFLVKLGDTVRATYGNVMSAFATVPVQKEVVLRILILRNKDKAEGGTEVISKAKVEQYIQWADKIYAQIGIRFVELPKIQIVDPPPNVNVAHFTVSQNHVYDGFSSNEKNLLAYDRAPGDRQIQVYYVGTMLYPDGDRLWGRAYAAWIFKGNPLTTQYADSTILSSDVRTKIPEFGGWVLSHEIGHILLNSGKQDHKVGTEGVNQVNFMAVPGYVLIGLSTDSRRITQAQENEMLNNRKNLLFNP